MIAALLTVLRRVVRIPLRALRLLLLMMVIAPLAGGSAFASVLREIPANAARMVMIFAGSNAVTIKADSFFKSNTVLKLSAGSQIRDTDNRIVLPSYVAGEFKVRAQLDNNGQIHRVWILTPAEIAAPDPKQ